jgi:hypothetical protein
MKIHLPGLSRTLNLKPPLPAYLGKSSEFTMQHILRYLGLGLCALTIGACDRAVNPNATSPQADAPPTIVTLTQTGCQFLETEGKDYAYSPKSAEDCKTINQSSLSQRQTQFKPLKLKPGKYIFRVTNRNVPYALGFYLRGQGLSQATLPKVSGGGLSTGVSQDYTIDLKAGTYDLSCPLNPTPDYPLVVEG